MNEINITNTYNNLLDEAWDNLDSPNIVAFRSCLFSQELQKSGKLERAKSIINQALQMEGLSLSARTWLLYEKTEILDKESKVFFFRFPHLSLCISEQYDPSKAIQYAKYALHKLENIEAPNIKAWLCLYISKESKKLGADKSHYEKFWIKEAVNFHPRDQEINLRLSALKEEQIDINDFSTIEAFINEKDDFILTNAEHQATELIEEARKELEKKDEPLIEQDDFNGKWSYLDLITKPVKYFNRFLHSDPPS